MILDLLLLTSSPRPLRDNWLGLPGDLQRWLEERASRRSRSRRRARGTTAPFATIWRGAASARQAQPLVDSIGTSGSAGGLVGFESRDRFRTWVAELRPHTSLPPGEGLGVSEQRIHPRYPAMPLSSSASRTPGRCACRTAARNQPSTVVERRPSPPARCWSRRRSAGLSPCDTAGRRSCESDCPTTRCPSRRRTVRARPFGRRGAARRFARAGASWL